MVKHHNVDEPIAIPVVDDYGRGAHGGGARRAAGFHQVQAGRGG